MGKKVTTTVRGRLEWSDVGAFIIVKYGVSAKGALRRAGILGRGLGVTLAGREDMNMIFAGALVPCSVFEVLGLKRIPDDMEVTAPFMLAELPPSA